MGSRRALRAAGAGLMGLSAQMELNRRDALERQKQQNLLDIASGKRDIAREEMAANADHWKQQDAQKERQHQESMQSRADAKAIGQERNALYREGMSNEEAHKKQQRIDKAFTRVQDRYDNLSARAPENVDTHQYMAARDQLIKSNSGFEGDSEQLTTSLAALEQSFADTQNANFNGTPEEQGAYRKRIDRYIKEVKSFEKYADNALSRADSEWAESGQSVIDMLDVSSSVRAEMDPSAPPDDPADMAAIEEAEKAAAGVAATAPPSASLQGHTRGWMMDAVSGLFPDDPPPAVNLGTGAVDFDLYGSGFGGPDARRGAIAGMPLMRDGQE